MLIKKENEIGEVVLDVKDINVLNNRDLPVLNGLSINVRKGEILGIAGVDGNGQSELIEANYRSKKSRIWKYFYFR